MTHEPDFQGRIGRTFRESEPWWPALRTAGQDRPNVVVILFDDTGFAHLGCYGSSIATPNIDRLADGGLRFANFHVTALCSPTRASLLTGRNHHTVGMRSIASYDPGFPNMRGAISKNAATMAEILRDQRYATFAVASGTSTPPKNAPPPDPIPTGPSSAASTASTDSSAAKPISTTPISSTTTTSSIPPNRPKTATI